MTARTLAYLAGAAATLPAALILAAHLVTTKPEEPAPSNPITACLNSPTMDAHLACLNEAARRAGMRVVFIGGESGQPPGTAALTASERADLAATLGPCWNLGPSRLPEGVDVSAAMRLEIGSDGTVQSVQAVAPILDPNQRAVFDAARRALLDPRCSRLPLSRERLARMRGVIRFDPRHLSLS